MTPKEKAKQLYDKMEFETKYNSQPSTVDVMCKKLALVCVDELISCLPSINGRPPNYQDRDKYTSEYWQEVKKEIR